MRNKKSARRTLQCKQWESSLIFDINRFSNVICMGIMNSFWWRILHFGFSFPWGVDTSSLQWDEIVWNITRNTANRPVELKSLIQLKNLPIKPQEKLGILSFAPLMCKELSTLYLWRLRKVDLSNYFKLSHVFGLFQLISQRKFQENLTCNSCLNLNVVRFEIAILWLFLYTVWG